MSLIIEALKRARDDSLRRQAAARGLPLATIQRQKRRRSWLAIAIVPLAAALVICVLLLIDLYSRLPKTGEVPTPPVATLDPAAAPAEPPATGSSVSSAPIEVPEAPATEESGAVAVVSPTASDSGREAASVPAGSSPSRPEAAVTPSPTEPPSAVSEPVEAGRDPQGSRVFVGQARLENGQVVDLGGIAWSESEPYALLNGQVVGVGELIRTYRVVEITRSEVVLQHDGDRVVVRLE